MLHKSDHEIHMPISTFRKNNENVTAEVNWAIKLVEEIYIEQFYN